VSYRIGDVVFWVLGTTSGEGTFISHPKDDKVGKILVTGGRGSWRRDRRRRLQPDGPQ